MTMATDFAAGGRPGTGSTTRWALISVALLVLLLIIGGVAALSFWSDIFSALADIDQRQEQLDGLKQAAARRLPDAAHPGGPKDQRNPYLTGETETIAAAQFQELVLKTVETTKASLSSAQVRPRTSLDQPAAPAASGEVPDRQLDLEVVFEARMTDTQTILFTLETGAPYIFVDEMQMQPVKSTQPGEAADPDPLLHVVLAMHSYWRS